MILHCRVIVKIFDDYSALLRCSDVFGGRIIESRARAGDKSSLDWRRR